ncbi:HAUS augmin-like complex subunit 4 isoform X2 [Tubulanus polymorphus]
MPDLSKEDYQKYPGFVNLLNSITHHISETGISYDTVDEIAQARESLTFQKLKWINGNILLNTIHEIVEDQEIEDTSQRQQSSKFSVAVKAMLNSAECSDYLTCHPDPTSNLTLFNLDKVDLQRLNKQEYESVKSELMSEIRKRLELKVRRLIQFHLPQQTEGICSAEGFSRSIINDVSQLQQQKDLVKGEIKLRHNLLEVYHKVVMKSIRNVEELISTYKLKFQLNSDKTNCDWLLAKGEGLMLKLKKLECERLYYTYCQNDYEPAKVLGKIERELDQRIEKKLSDLDDMTKVIEAYQSVGMGFDELVNEYSKLKQHYDMQKLALTDLALNMAS